MKNLIFLFIICTIIIGSCKKKDPIQYELKTTVIPIEGGTISPSSGLYKEGESTILTAIPSSEYLFVGWTDGASGTVNPLSVIMNNSKNITATFEKRKYPLTLNIEGDGTVKEEILQAKSVTNYSSGTIVKLTAVPNMDSEFIGWDGDYQGIDISVTITVDKPKSIKASFKKSRIKFISKSPSYTYPNNTNGQIKRGYFFPGFYSSGKEYIMSGWGLWATQTTYIDYNNDGFLDYFGFYANHTDNPFTSGKYFLTTDVLGKTPETKTVDCTTRWPPTFEINDINNDGFNEIIQGNWNSHDIPNGTHGAQTAPINVIYFNKDGTLTVKEVGELNDIHDFSTADIDNDGDIDILICTNSGPKFGDAQPILFLNDGNGNYKQSDGYSTFKGLEEILNVHNGHYYIITMELFDLNNDGYLDIITGQNIGLSTDPTSLYQLPNCRIYWGNSTHTFDLLNRYSDLTTTSIKDFSQFYYIVLGFSFIDYDKDGDYDVLCNTSPAGRGFHIQLFENLGNEKFIEVTESKLDGFSNTYDANRSQPTYFSAFASIRLYDKDDDGDFDIVPDLNSYPDLFAPNVYWENAGGRFIRRNYY